MTVNITPLHDRVLVRKLERRKASDTTTDTGHSVAKDPNIIVIRAQAFNRKPLSSRLRPIHKRIQEAPHKLETHLKP